METKHELSRRSALAMAAALPLTTTLQPASAANAATDQQHGFDFLIGDWRCSIANCESGWRAIASGSTSPVRCRFPRSCTAPAISIAMNWPIRTGL